MIGGVLPASTAAGLPTVVTLRVFGRRGKRQGETDSFRGVSLSVRRLASAW
ncbi:hypothetical protein [Frankia sp. Cppng1_Ct_nod]|uniref:hypothetical protein n=1 Tax=Frankia sp. Cppng1_Ct_nod TaxID=2897162 RepID=UPI0013EF60A4|nr:hypothetical protein [Frankia sp. Cppng1_Ct_nod]